MAVAGGGGEHDRAVLVDADLDEAPRVAELEGEGVVHHDTGGVAETVIRMFMMSPY
jgi:hypothetical protein